MSIEEIKVVVTAQDKASGVLSKFGTNVKNLQSTFKGMAVAGTAAFVGITAFIGTSIKNAVEAEKSNRQLENSIIKISKGTQDQVK